MRTRSDLRRTLICLLVLLLAPGPTASAHPHEFYEVHVRILIGSGGDVWAEFRVLADEITSHLIRSAADQDGDGECSDAEMAELQEMGNLSFKMAGYYIRTDDDVKVEEVLSYTLKVREDKPERYVISYRARLKVDGPADGAERSLRVQLYDKTNYIAFTLLPENVKVLPQDSRVKVSKVTRLKTLNGAGVTYRIVAPAAAVEDTGAASAPAEVVTTDVEDPTLYARLQVWLQAGREKIMAQIRSLSEDFDAGIFIGLVAFAVLYGVFHALGPGHGKALVAAFMMRGSSRPWHAVLLSVVVTLSHTGSSLILILLLQKILGAVFSGSITRAQTTGAVGIISGGIIVVIGVALMIGMRREASSEVSEDAVTMTQVARWGLAVGLVPCPASAIIMLAASTAGVLWLGLVLVVALSVGLSGVLLAISMGTLYAKKGITTLAAHKEGWAARVRYGVALGGNLMVIGLGLVLIFVHVGLVV